MAITRYIPAVEDAIDLYLRANNMTRVDLARKLDVSQQAVSGVLGRGFGVAAAKRWARTFGFNPRFLMTGEGDLLLDNTPADDENENAVAIPLEQANYREIPLLPVLAQAGHLSDFADSVSEFDCEKVISPVRDAEIAVTVYGESMYPDFPNGSIVFVKRIDEAAFIEWGKCYIVDTVNGPLIKYLAPSEKEGCVKCISANRDPRYAPFDVNTADIRALFKVVMSMCMK